MFCVQKQKKILPNFTNLAYVRSFIQDEILGS